MRGLAMKTVYVELIVLDNMFMNMLILYTASFAIKARARLWRVAVAAFIGTLYALALILSSASVLSNWIIKILLSLLMALIAYNPRSIKAFFKSLCSLYVFTFVYGGAVIGMNYMLSNNMLITGSVLYFDGRVRSVFLFIAAAALITYAVLRAVRHKSDIKTCDMVISINGNSQPLCALIDTGNSLREPLSDEPIIVCDKQLLDSGGLISEKEDYLYINCASVSGEIEIPCLRAEKIRLIQGKKEINLDNVWIGLSPRTLSEDGSYSALLPPELYNCMK